MYYKDVSEMRSMQVRLIRMQCGGGMQPLLSKPQESFKVKPVTQHWTSRYVLCLTPARCMRSASGGVAAELTWQRRLTTGPPAASTNRGILIPICNTLAIKSILEIPRRREKQMGKMLTCGSSVHPSMSLQLLV